jgi:polygalacturonase
MRTLRNFVGWPSALVLLAASLACGGGGGAPAPVLGTDASLSALTPSAGVLTPAFASGTTTYQLTVPFGTDTVTLAATPRDPHASAITVSQDGGVPLPLASGEPSLDVPALGSTSSIAVKVTAEDGRTQRTYLVTLSRSTAVAPDPSLCGAAAATAPIADTSPNFPTEPAIPTPCQNATLEAAYAVDGATGLPVFTAGKDALDTSRIQAAIDACAASLGTGAKGSVRLQPSASSAGLVAFVAGPLNLRAGVTLWVDKGTTLFASRKPSDYDMTAGACGTDAGNSSSGCKPFIAVNGVAGAGVAGQGVIDGLGGEPVVDASNNVLATTWWDVAWQANTDKKSFSNPRLIDVNRANGFTLYQITLRNSPKFHVGLGSAGFVVWGVHIQTPSRATNSQGKALTPAYARNTDGIDPYDASNGYIVYSTISTGDDQIALKCGDGPIDPMAPASCWKITIAHDHLGTGHGISIGSETNAGRTDGTGSAVDGLHVYDVSIDGLIPNGGAGDVNVNGLRIKSDRSIGGIVKNVTYEDVCMRGLANPILLNPYYDPKATGNSIPTFQGVTFRNVRHVDCSASAAVPTPVVTLYGFDASHITQVSLDGVVVDGIAAASVRASDASVALGPGPVNFTPSGTGVSVTGQTGAGAPNACAGKFVALSVAQ